MHQRLPLVLSATALAVAVLGATPIGQAAGEQVASAVPLAKRANFAKQAGNAAKLNGRRSTVSGAPGTIPVVGASGKLPASIGAVGPQGPKGDRGESGPPGISDYERVEALRTINPGDTFVTVSASCPAGKRIIGGGGFTQESKLRPTYSFPQSNDIWQFTAVLIPGQVITQTAQAGAIAICARVG
jgi:hypothetical protein